MKSAMACGKESEQRREYLQDEESTVAPSETLRDDASEVTENWCYLETPDDEVSSAVSTSASTVTEGGGRLVEGPGGRPTRVFATAKELREARLKQMNPGASKERPMARTAQAAVGPKERERLRQEAKAALAANLAAQAQAKGGPSAGRPKTAPMSSTYGAHRTLGDPLATHSLPCGNISFHNGPLGQAERKPTRQELAKDHQAKDAKLAMDKMSKEELQEMGLWEYMPCRNPIITESDSKRGGYNWHLPFPAQEFEHTLGGVADSKPVARPHKADDAFRQLDVLTRESLRDAGMWEHCPGRNPVATESVSKRGGVNWTISPF